MLQIDTLKEFIYRFFTGRSDNVYYLAENRSVNWWNPCCGKLMFSAAQDINFTHRFGLLHKQFHHCLIQFPAWRLTYWELRQVQTLKHLLPEFPYLARGLLTPRAIPKRGYLGVNNLSCSVSPSKRQVLKRRAQLLVGTGVVRTCWKAEHAGRRHGNILFMSSLWGYGILNSLKRMYVSVFIKLMPKNLKQ